MASRYFQHQFPGGLTLLGEAMSGVQSAAMMLLLPAGACNDPIGAGGAATSSPTLSFAAPVRAIVASLWIISTGSDCSVPAASASITPISVVPASVPK